MNPVQQLLTENIGLWSCADTAKKTGRGRASGSAGTVYGIKKLRELILELAVRGKLVPQDPSDEPANALLGRIRKEKERQILDGKIKKDKPIAAISDGEKPFALPQGWEWTRLGDVAYSQAGFSFKSNGFNESGAGLPLVRIRDVGQTFTGTYFDGEYRDEFIVVKNDYLISMDGEFRVAKWVNGKALLNQRVSRLIFFGEETVASFIAETLQFQLRKLQGVKAYTTVDHLSGGQISKSIFAFPPLAEQYRIVAKVDELMVLCDQLENDHVEVVDAHEKLVSHLLATLTASQESADFSASWQRISAHFDMLFTTEASIDTLKQTLLQLAVMGKLLPQDPCDEPASTLLERIQAEKAKLVFEGKIKKDKPLAAISDDEKPFELPQGWSWARFPELGEFGRGKSKHRPRNDPKLFSPGIYPLVQTGEVARANKVINEYHSKYSEIGLAQSKIWPIGTLCITIAANIADSALLGFDACFPDSVVGFVPYGPLDTSEYFLYFMKTARRNLLKFAPATAQKNINLEILESILIPIPPLKEIFRIVAKVDELMALCDRMKTRIADASAMQLKLADVMVAQAVA